MALDLGLRPLQGSGGDAKRKRGVCIVKIKSLATALAVTAGLCLSVSAHAAQPLDVDCDLLEATNDAVNDELDAAGVQFANLGQLVAAAILDEDVFNQLNALIEFFSGGEISFDSASQAVSTNAKCGLIPQLIDNIRD
jgi:hypothetical protein